MIKPEHRMAVGKHGGKLRLLALHSFRTSAAIFREQFTRAKLGEQTRDLVEVVFIDAPHHASGAIPRDVAPYFEGPYYEWFTVDTMGDKVVFDEDKVKQSTEYVARVLQDQGPFDGIVGFSQGAMFASSLIAMQHNGAALQNVPLLKFCILFAGLKSRHPDHEACMVEKVQVPSLHIYSDRDYIKEHCDALVEAFEDAIVIKHSRGHSIPAMNEQQIGTLRVFLASFLTPVVPQQQAGVAPSKL